MHGPVSRGEEHFAFIRAAGSAHVRHAEALEPLLYGVIAKAVIFRVGTKLHHPEWSDGAWKKVDTVVRITASADQWIDV
jgi:hypothetical protein